MIRWIHCNLLKLKSVRLSWFAKDWGTYVCAHVYTSAGIQRALACGVQSIEHGQLADEETVKQMADARCMVGIQPFLADKKTPMFMPRRYRVISRN